MPAATRFTTFPEEIQGLILARCGLEDCPPFVLFCKAWHRLVYEQPELWRSLRVHVPESGSTTGGGSPAPPLRWLAGKLALRRRVGPLVSRLHLVGSGSVGVPPQLLPCLQQATLEELILTQPRELPPAMASTLTGFSGLHSLELAVLGTRPLPLTTTQAVAAAPGLRRLTLMAGRLQPALLRGCLAAQQLTLLELTSSDVPLPPLHPLTALTALRELSAFEWCSGAGGMRPLPLSAFPAIRRLAFRSTAFQLADGLEARSAPGARYAMFQLRMLPAAAAQPSPHLRPSQPVGQPAASASPGGDWVFACSGLELGRELPLHAMLRALGVRGASLVRLSMEECQLSPAAFLPPPPGSSDPLAGVQRLILESLLPAGGGGGNFAAEGGQPHQPGGGAAPPSEGLDALLRQMMLSMPRLSVLNLLGTPLPGGSPPASLLQLTRLTVLQMSGCQLATLPQSPVVSRLAVLALDSNNLEVLPPALAGARQLETLVLTGNPELRVAAADVEAGGALGAQTALTLMELPAGAIDKAAVQRLAQRLPRLRVVLK